MARVPFLDLKAATTELRLEINAAVERVIASGWFLLGEELERFEQAWAATCGAKFCVGVGSGLDALWLALTAKGIGHGDEVIVPSQTFVATWRAVTLTGATVVPADVDPLTHSLDLAATEAAITPQTAAILSVDLYGHPAAHPELREIADRHGLFFISDSAQAHGATLGGRPVGAWADAACWSFYPGKNLGGLGDGGAVTTDDPELADTLRRLRNYGSSRKYLHTEEGVNSRLDEIQAAVLHVKLAHLEEWNARRKRIACRYLDELAGSSVSMPGVDQRAEPSWHLFAVTHPERDSLRSHLDQAGIDTLIHYPTPPHLQPAYARYGYGRSLPVAERVARETLSLPIGPHLQDDSVAQVIDAVRVWQH